MNDDAKLEILRTTYGSANNCPDHPDCVPWKMEDVQEVIHAYTLTDGEYSESDSVCVVRLKDGTFGTVMEWGDTTGHGCQCAGEGGTFASLEDALRLGLDQRQRALLLEVR